MGSWNGTCAVSNLHVRYGQDVAVFLLIKNQNLTSFCYSNALYNVCPLPFYGKYNDYGAVEECHGFGLDIAMESLRSKLYKFGQGPNSSHDCEVNKDNLDIDLLFEADSEDRLGIDDPYSWDGTAYDRRELERMREEKGLTDSQQYELDRLAAKMRNQDGFRQVTHVIIHGDIFRAIMEKWYIEEYVGENKGNKGYNNCYVHIYFKDIVASIPEYIQYKKEKREQFKNLTKEIQSGDPALDAAKQRQLFRLMSTTDMPWNDPCITKRWMRQFEDPSADSNRVWDLVRAKDYIDQYTEAEDWDSLEKLAYELLTAAWINSFMSFSRKIWTKQAGAGSQSGEYISYEILSNAVLDIIKEERREYEEDNE